MPLTQEQLRNLLLGGDMAMNVVGNVMAGKAASYERERQAQMDAYNRALQQYNMMQSVRGAQAGLTQDQLTSQTDRAKMMAMLDPLGAEQALAQRNAMIANMIPQVANMPTSSAYGGVVNPMIGMSTEPFGQASTAAAIAQKRKELASIMPEFQFGSMGAYGLGDAATPEDAAVANYQKTVMDTRTQREQQLRDLVEEQRKAAEDFAATQQQQDAAAAQPQKKKGGFWKTLGKIASVAAPIVAAPFTGGATLALIGAGAGAAGGALQGGGVKGALLGGATGALSGGLGGGANAARGAAGAVKESVGSAIKRAVLNPRAIAQISSAALPGQAGQAARMASVLLPGAKAWQNPVPGSPLSPPTLTAADVARGQASLAGVGYFNPADPLGLYPNRPTTVIPPSPGNPLGIAPTSRRQYGNFEPGLFNAAMMSGPASLPDAEYGFSQALANRPAVVNAIRPTPKRPISVVPADMFTGGAGSYRLHSISNQGIY